MKYAVQALMLIKLRLLSISQILSASDGVVYLMHFLSALCMAINLVVEVHYGVYNRQSLATGKILH